MNIITNEKIMLRDMRDLIKQDLLNELKLYFVKSPLTNNEIYSDLQYNINEAFIFSCIHGNLPIIQYLLTSSELNIHADIHYKNDDSIFCALDNRHSQIVDYLSFSSELKEHLDIYVGLDDYFEELIENFYIKDENYSFGDVSAPSLNEYVVDTINYLIYEYNISSTPHIVSLLGKHTKASYYEPAIKQLNSNIVYNNYHNLLIKTDNITTDKKETKKKKI